MSANALLTAVLLFGTCASPARADEMFAWEKVAQSAVKAERLPAAQAGQAMDMVRAAIDDAVNATAPFGGGPSADIAAAVAAHDVLVKLFPTRRARLDARLQKVRVAGIDESVIEAAAMAGHQAASSVLASEWSWRRAAIPYEVPRGAPKVKSLTLPMHQTSGTLKLHKDQPAKTDKL